MNTGSKIFIFTGAAVGIVTMALFFLGYLNDSPERVLARKVITGAAFIVIGIGFLMHKEKSWKILGTLAIIVNALVIFFWVSMRDFM